MKIDLELFRTFKAVFEIGTISYFQLCQGRSDFIV